MSRGSPHNYLSACVTTEDLDQCHSYANERTAYLMSFWILIINLTVTPLYF